MNFEKLCNLGLLNNFAVSFVGGEYIVRMKPMGTKKYTTDLNLAVQLMQDECQLVGKEWRNIQESDCVCGNAQWFECSYQWSKDNPGNTTYYCGFCGIYEAGLPKCNHCLPESDS